MRPPTTALLITAGLLIALTAAADGGARVGATGTPSPSLPRTAAAASSGQLDFTREDGSTFTIRAQDLEIRCERLDTKTPVDGITVIGPKSAFDYEKKIIRAPFVDIQAVLADVRHGLHQAMPTANSYTGKGANIFVGDPGGEFSPENPNELQSDQEDSSGSMFVRGRCGTSPKLELRIDATIGSEYGDSPPIHVKGAIVVRK